MDKIVRFCVFILMFLLVFNCAWAAEENLPVDLQVIGSAPQASVPQVPGTDKSQQTLVLAQAMPSNKYVDPLKYTLGPDDVVEITVMRHGEFSGVYPVNLEGKIQYKFVGDIDVTGLTKKGLEDKIKEIIGTFVINPEVNVTVMEYKSKVIYVLGEVGMPGKYYMRSESIPIREAVVQAGLPTLSAAMRRCRLVTPDKNGKVKTKMVDLYSLLYGGNLQHNVDMKPGDVLYVPATIMAKVMRVINPVTAPVSSAASGYKSATTLTP